MFETMKKKNRNFWTAERDEELKRFEAGGLSASQIAAVLGTTRGAVLGRSNRLRGKLFRSDVENRQREKSKAAERRAKKQAQSPGHAATGADLEAEKRETAALVDALRADLAAGIERDEAIRRALRVGHKPAEIGAFFVLSIAQVHQIAGLRQGPRRWTRERVELLRSMWPDHTANEIAAALGTTPGGVHSISLRLGLSRRTAKNKPGEPEYLAPPASAAAPA
jgi:hypothetical protein